MASESLKLESSFLKIRILVVDDDFTCLNIVSACLKRWKYEVVTALHPADALSTLRGKQEKVDLVVIDYHMPDMNGLELQEKVQNEFELPVIMMSADDSEYIMLRSLEGGAVFFMVKPIHPEELKNVWQYVVKGKGGRSSLIERIARPIPGGSPLLADEGTCSSQHHQHCAVQSASPSINLIIRDGNHPDNNEPQNPRTCAVDSNYKQKQVQEKGVKDKAQSREKQKEYFNAAPRKPKVIWTTALHHRFLQALSLVGIERAVPRKILDLMNVPGLKRSNVASHLQKYRIFLKQVEESAAQKRTSLSGLPSMLGNDIETTQDILDISIPRPLQAFQPDYQGIYSIQGYHQSNNTSLFPTKAPMNGGILSKFGSLGKPNCSLSTTSSRAGGWKQPIVPGNRVQSGLYQPGSPMTAAPMNQASGTDQRNLHLMGDYASYDSGYSAQGLGNMRQMHHQESLLAPELYNSRMLRCGVGSSGMSNVNSCVGGTGSFANCVAPPSLSELNSNSNYVGTRLSGNGHFHRLGRPQPSGTGAEINWLEAGFGSIGGTRPCTEKLTTSGQGTSNRTYFTPQQASASTFWPADSSEGFSTISDQGIDASNNEENHYAINELVRNVLGTGSGNSHQLISGEGCPKSSPLERVNYQSAVPTQDHGSIASPGVANGPYQVEVNTQRNEVVNPEFYKSQSGEGNSSVCHKPSLGQYGDSCNGENATPRADVLPAPCDVDLNWQAYLVSEENGAGHTLNAGINNTMQPPNTLIADASENKEWEDDFIESLLGEVAPYLDD